MSLRVVRCPNDPLSARNSAVVSGLNPQLRNSKYALVNNRCPVRVEIYDGPGIGQTDIGFNGKQRDWVGVRISDTVSAKDLPLNTSNQAIYISGMTVEVNYFGGKQRKKDASVINTEELLKEFSDLFVKNKMVFSVGQEVVLQFEKFPVLEGVVTQLELFKGGPTPPKIEGVEYGLITSNSVVNFEKKSGSTMTLTGSKTQHSGRTAIISPDWDFSTMGIGGLHKEFNDIFRRAFSSRVFPPEVVAKMGMKHVRGILLYGPPGTGKTLMARQIGKMLHAREPKIIHGPEILDKYVGQSEANVRALFAEAEVEEKKMGIHSALHIIIFDEIDAICRQRGSLSGSTGVHDTVVNQLLAKIDGVEQLNNILLIGMTNRKDMIDDALLRPGRLEVQMEISLPNESGRVEILQIHTAQLRENKGLSKEVDLYELAKKTRNFSGAELEGLVRSATTTAMNRMITGKKKIEVTYSEAENLLITKDDFEHALLHDIKPAFGISDDELKGYIRNGIVKWGGPVNEMLTRGELVKQQAKESTRNYLSSLLLRGPPGAGKTSLAVHMAQDDNFPFVKVVSPETTIGFSESAKCQKIKKVFDDAYKSPISCIVIDDIERLLDYVSIGPRFSNLVLQAMLVLLRKQPPPGHRLLILGTTSLPDDTLESLGIKDAFNVSIYTPYLSKTSEVVHVLRECGMLDDQQLKQLEKELKGYSIKIAIKKLLALADIDAGSQSTDSVSELMMILLQEGAVKML